MVQNVTYDVYHISQALARGLTRHGATDRWVYVRHIWNCSQTLNKIYYTRNDRYCLLSYLLIPTLFYTIVKITATNSPECTVTFPGQHESVVGGSGPGSVSSGRTRSGVPALPGPGYHRQHGHQPHLPARPRLQLSTAAQTVPDTSRQVASFIKCIGMLLVIMYDFSMFLLFTFF